MGDDTWTLVDSWGESETFSVRRYTGALLLRGDDEWHCIEKAAHEHVSMFVPTNYGARLFLSSRLSDCDVEGPAGDMLGLAQAVKDGRHYEARRCAVAPHGGGFVMWSPRNDNESVGWVTARAANDLADHILATLR
jgi:hypothetical protein